MTALQVSEKLFTMTCLIQSLCGVRLQILLLEPSHHAVRKPKQPRGEAHVQRNGDFRVSELESSSS
jgi:hypothetical protein